MIIDSQLEKKRERLERAEKLLHEAIDIIEAAGNGLNRTLLEGTYRSADDLAKLALKLVSQDLDATYAQIARMNR